MDKNITLNFSKHVFNKYIVYIIFHLYTILALIFIRACKSILCKDVPRNCDCSVFYSFSIEARTIFAFSTVQLFFFVL